MTVNERLTIDEIIQHCNRTCENTEMLAIARGQNREDITSKGYWEHYQVANYLEELKQYRAIGTLEEIKEALAVKEELIKALQYDRGQYEKGYSDGYAKAISDFYDKVLNFEDYIDPEATNGSRLLYAGVDITDMVVKIAEEIRGAT